MSATADESFDESTHLLSERRTSILDQDLGLFRGPNTLHKFALSFTRAQSFAANKLDTDLHKKRSFFARETSDSAPHDELFDLDLMVALLHGERLSTLIHDVLLRLNGAQGYSTYNEVFLQDDSAHFLQETSRSGSQATILMTSKRGLPRQSFSSMRLALSHASMASHFGLKKVEDADGNLVTVIAGQSTAPQTVLNSVNVLVGIGLLALPVGLLRGGWVLGLPLLVGCCLVTCWSATLLLHALDTDRTMMTYADLGFLSYGKTAKLLISLIFFVDLLGLGVSLVLLFSDSLYSLMGDDTYWTKTRFKLVSFLVLTPFTFLPLPILSVFSLFGIMATVFITVLMFACGLFKQVSPGSLIHAMPTNLWPLSIPELFIALGILMATFGGHAIFPNLKSDMRHPRKFTKVLFTTYTITLLTDCSMAVIGFLMFGALCSNEITSILLETAGYPVWIHPLISGLICIVPLAKTPLNSKPIISTFDGLFELDSMIEGEPAFKRFFKNGCRFLVRVGVNALFVGFSVVFPEFDKIIGILGSSICFIICIILPCLFYLKLCKNQIGDIERQAIKVVIFVSSALAVMCTSATIAF